MILALFAVLCLFLSPMRFFGVRELAPAFAGWMQAEQAQPAKSGGKPPHSKLGLSFVAWMSRRRDLASSRRWGILRALLGGLTIPNVGLRFAHPTYAGYKAASLRTVLMPRNVACTFNLRSNSALENFDSLCFWRHSQYTSRPCAQNSSISVRKLSSVL